VSQREAIQAALAAWRDAERRLFAAVDGEAAAIAAEVDRHRDEYRHLSSDFMSERLQRLNEAEHRRASSTPSTPPFHQAARDTQEIAADIWEAGRQGDLDTPQRAPVEVP
jgi:hypothetical protein